MNPDSNRPPARRRRLRLPLPVAISPEPPHKVVATFSIPEDNWPPPGELEEALHAASDAFVYVLRIALEQKLRGDVIAHLDYAPPNPNLN
jgi:hypothetical protein